jgi:hypothetical protein
MDPGTFLPAMIVPMVVTPLAKPTSLPTNTPPAIKRAAEELFVPCAFNTWDRSDESRNKAMTQWGAGLASS